MGWLWNAGESEEDLVSAWFESLFPVEFLLLHASPTYYGLGVTRGDLSSVITIPGFGYGDFYLFVMNTWLRRLGYRAYRSGIKVAQFAGDQTWERRVNETLDRALRETGRRVHLVGHSLGGIIARHIARRRPQDIASVITLGSPFRAVSGDPGVLRIGRSERKKLARKTHGSTKHVPIPRPGSSRAAPAFVLPASVAQTAIFSRNDGVVDWRYCMTGDSHIDVEVPGTHAGLAFNPSVYDVIASRLAGDIAPALRASRRRVLLRAPFA